MLKVLKTISLTTLSLSALLSVSAMANDQDQNDKPSRKGPPPEAFTACSNLNVGDACSFSTTRGDLNGMCRQPPHGEGEIACAPKGGKKKSKGERSGE